MQSFQQKTLEYKITILFKRFTPIYRCHRWGGKQMISSKYALKTGILRLNLSFCKKKMENKDTNI